LTYKNILKHKGTYIDFTRTHKMDIKQFALAVHNFAYGTNWDDEDIVSAMDFETIVEKMKNDEKELKEQVEDAHQKGFDAGREEYQVDQEFLDEKDDEIKELKEKYDHLRSVHSKVVQDLNARTEQVVELTLQHELTLHHE